MEPRVIVAQIERTGYYCLRCGDVCCRGKYHRSGDELYEEHAADMDHEGLIAWVETHAWHIDAAGHVTRLAPAVALAAIAAAKEGAT